MQNELSYEAEEYVATIYRLQRRNGAAKTKELAKELGVVPGSITNTIEHLEKHGLVIHKPYRGVKLTETGEKLALSIIRRHRLAERLLTDILAAEWKDVHEDACKLEHALTDEVVELLEKRLGEPKSCPHGNPIPTANGKLEEEVCYQLTKIAPDKNCIVAKITDEKHEKLLILASKGIRPNVRVKVVKQLSSQIVLRVAGKKCTLNRDLAANVWVKTIRSKEHDRRKEKFRQAKHEL
jgi:DtxR family Mn-dependent transcriptional regulator